MAVPKVCEHCAVRLPSNQLSPRELEVAEHISLGESIKEIGYNLHLSPRTVDTHKQRIFEKLEVNTSIKMMRKLLKMGVLSIESGSASESKEHAEVGM